MISFAILAMAALVIDLGFVRLARFQMQSAVSSAALEGMRFRDDLPDYIFSPGSALMTEIEAECGPRPDPPDIDSNQAYRDWLDHARRVATSRLVERIFDDDLDPADGDPLAYGAGPILDFSDGVTLDGTNFRASQFISIPDPHVYKPALRSNLSNDPVGDMVPGNYRDGVGIDHVEQPDYSRDDFDPTAIASGFLVRTRRTNEAFDPSRDSSSGGPAVPFLFGRGSLVALDNRAQGVSVRSTAIAAALRAKSVGLADPGNALPGATPFVLTQMSWDSIPVNSQNAVTMGNSTPNVMVGGSPSGVVIKLIKLHASDNDSDVTKTALGQPAIALSGNLTWDEWKQIVASQFPTSGSSIAYVPIVANIGSVQAIVGFGFVNVTNVVIDDVTQTLSATLTKRTNRIAAVNGSAVVTEILPDMFSDQPNDPDLAAIFNAHSGTRAFADPLFAPSSVR